MDIFKKMEIINRNKNKELLDYMDEYTKLEFIYGGLLLSGSEIKKSEVLRIMRGDMVREASVIDHGKINSYMGTLKYMDELIEMDFDLETRYIMELAEKLLGISKQDFRKTNPTLRDIRYTPPHCSRVKELMKDLDKWLISNETNKDFNRKIPGMYLKIIEIYPVEENNHELANMAVCYEYKKRGLPPSGLNLKAAEYEDLLRRYFLTGNLESMYLKFYENQEKHLNHIIERFELL